MKTKAIVVSFVCLLVVLFLPGVARAQTTDCNNPVGLVADGRIQPGTTYFIPAATTHWFDLPGGKANRSYSIEIEPVFAGVSVNLPGVFRQTGFNFVACTGTALTTRETAFNDPLNDLLTFGAFNGERVSFTATVLDDYLISITSGGTGFSYRIAIAETTLYNPLWSTFGGFETFYKFYNTTGGATCTVTLRFRNDADAAVATATIVIPANNTSATRNTGPADLNVANDQTGHAFITHDCPPGAIQVDGFLGFFGTTTSVLPIKILSAREGFR